MYIANFMVSDENAKNKEVRCVLWSHKMLKWNHNVRKELETKTETKNKTTGRKE